MFFEANFYLFFGIFKGYPDPSRSPFPFPATLALQLFYGNCMTRTIAIIGLGYVGLPLAVAFGKRFETIGFDQSTSYSGATGVICIPIFEKHSGLEWNWEFASVINTFNKGVA